MTQHQKTHPEACGCCEGIEKLTPLPTANRPGLSALQYRVGTHSAFLETMQARLSDLCLELADDQNDGEQRICPLRNLTTREASDPSIALLDAWATVADVLTFYQERIANEGYLRTAIERRSILELARLIGYELQPGVAASVYLAFTLEDGQQVEIPAGTQARSKPGPDESPQTFETAQPLQARAAWNTLKPRMREPQDIERKLNSGETLYFEGTSTNLTPNASLLFSSGSTPTDQLFKRVRSVETKTAENQTHVTLQGAPTTTTMALSSAARPVGERVRTVIERYSDLTEYDIDGTNMANDVVARLETLSEQLAAATSPAESQNAIEQALSYLRAKHTTAEENNYTNLEPWLAQIVADLEAVASDAETTALSLPLSETSSHSAEVEVGPEAPPLLAGLNEIVPDLLKLPSLQPANALRLPRNIRQTFALQSDTLPSLLTSLQPQLKDTLYPALANLAVGRPTRVQSVQALRVKAAPFGHNAPLKPSYKDDGSVTYSEWGLEPVDTSDKKRIFLDSEYDQILPDSWITIERTPIDGTQKQPEYFQVQEVATVSRADYGISGKVTRLTLNREWPVTDTDTDAPNLAVLRGVTVYAQGETLTPVDVPVEDDVAGDTITLDALYDGLEAGRWLVVSGERTDTPATQGVMGGELVMLAGVTQSSQTTGDQPHTTLKLANALSYTYKRESVTIYGNVVKATHGETREEVLGSGNGSQARQQFELKKSPLTYLAAPTPDGRESTLEVRVNHIRWHEADNLFALESTERGYSTRTDNEGTVTVTFGDGTHGARLPSGTENVRATYRKGIGKPGNVNAEQISMLATKPLGVKGVRNPLPASGGANREPRDQARRNAPLAVMALDRLVSVRDYADFARTFAGIGKASAVELSDGGRRVVHLTIAGADDIPVDPTSDLYRNLRRALLQYGDPHQPLQIDVRELKLLVISASVRVQPDYAWEFVAPEIRAALLDTFSFQRRELGQDVMRAEVISTIEQVPGVAYVDLDILHSIGGQLASTLSDFDQLFKTLNTEQQPRPRIVARTAAINRQATRPDERITPAQMIYLSTEVPDTLILKLKDG